MSLTISVTIVMLIVAETMSAATSQIFFMMTTMLQVERPNQHRLQRQLVRQAISHSSSFSSHDSQPG
jgi:hypothetical protein